MTRLEKYNMKQKILYGESIWRIDNDLSLLKGTKDKAGKIFEQGNLVIDLPPVEYIRFMSVYDMVSWDFEEYSYNDKLVIPDTVKRMDGNLSMFMRETKSIVIPDSVKSIGNCFESFDKLEDVQYNGKLENIISSDTFANTKFKDNNKKGGEPWIMGDTLIYIGMLALGEKINSLIKDMNIPSVKKIAPRIVSGYSSIDGDPMMKELDIPNNIERIGYEAFKEIGIRAVNIPGSVKIIEHGTFKNCRNLEYVEIGEGVEIIDIDAFYGCSRLKSIKLPDSLKYLNIGAFYNCTNLSNVSVCSSTKIIKTIHSDITPLLNAEERINSSVELDRDKDIQNSNWCFTYRQ